MSPDEPIDAHNPTGGMNEPHLQHSGALIDRQPDGLVVAGGCGRANLREPVRRAAHAALIRLGENGSDQNIRLHHGIDLLVLFCGVRQAHIERHDINTVYLALDGEPDLKVRLADEFLIDPGGRGRPAHGRDAINALSTPSVGRGEVLPERTSACITSWM